MLNFEWNKGIQLGLLRWFRDAGSFGVTFTPFLYQLLMDWNESYASRHFPLHIVCDFSTKPTHKHSYRRRERIKGLRERRDAIVWWW
jgi:hypothetical protein